MEILIVYGLPDNCVLLHMFCFYVGALLLARSSVQYIKLYLKPSRAIVGSLICMHLCSHCHKCFSSLDREAQRSFSVAEYNGHGPFCVITNQWGDEAVGSEDAHDMSSDAHEMSSDAHLCTTVTAMMIKKGDVTFPSSQILIAWTPWKHVKPKRWNRWKDYTLLISAALH